MAKIWPVYEGSEPTQRGPWAELPLSDAITLLELRDSDHVADLAAVPQFGPTDRDLWHLGHKHVIIEVDSTEGRKSGWNPGYYLARFGPNEVFRLLLQHAIAAELGETKVVRVDYQLTTDSQDQPALRVKVVLTQDALRNMEKDAPLNALVKLNDTLNDLRVDRTPIMEYVTMAELAEHDSPDF
jgi:hypothetical protein